ncbi:MAG: CocE/NonD family hydrolase [Acidimicrobiales bacterium]|jgi:predicted acyl esterase
MTSAGPKVAGTDSGQRQLNGPQTTGRVYQNLSEPSHRCVSDLDVAVPMRDGITLMVDVHRPLDGGRCPVLIAASPYPRQIQDLGAPMGFIEAGASDFFVPRGYVHVIANLRGTGGSGGVFGFHDSQERLDLYDLVEWAAEQPWSNGRVGMIGISYFAMTQLEAASEHPAHLEAIFPIATTSDLYEGVYHHGLFNSTFITPFLSMVGMTSQHDNLWRGKLVEAARRVLNTPRLHKRFATMNGESSIGVMKAALRLRHEPHPWDDLWRSVAVEHQMRDEWWDERNVLPLLEDVTIPVYLGCDWENVPLHLPGTFDALDALRHNEHVRVAMLGQYGLTWPWESLHVEALAWFDQWLKDRETGILEGPPIRYWLPVADAWRTSDYWPPAGYPLRELVLSADGSLAAGGPTTGSRKYLTLGTGLNRAQASPTDPPSFLIWTTDPLDRAWDVVGNMEVVLDAQSTALDTAWILTLQDVAPDESVVDVTQGFLRSSLRRVDDEASHPGAPVLPCRQTEAIPIGETVHYRIPLVPNARRIDAAHRLRLVLTSDDQREGAPAMMGFRHGTVGTNTINTVLGSSRLFLPVSEGGL